MRSVLVGLLLAATVLSGCASQPEAADDVIDPLTQEPAQSLLDSHPMYNLTTYMGLAEGNLSDFPAPGAWSIDNPPGVLAWKKPAYRDLPDVLQTIAFEARTADTRGAGIAVFGPLAFAGGTSGPMSIINIMDPTNPVVVSVAEDTPARDVDTILYPDGRLVTVSTNGGNPIVFTDVTDVYNPVVVSEVQTPHTNHNIAVVPGTPIVYNSVSGGSHTDIVDATDPDNAVFVKDWENGYGCHDMTFYMNQDENKFRAYCAGLDKIQIWDVADPLNPVVINEWGWPAAGVHDTGSASLVTFAHLAMPNHDASILILGDETGGGAAPGCDFSVHAQGTTVTGPLGNLWFYDISDEMTPVLKGSVSPSAHEQRGSCTAHFGRVVEDTNHVVMGFYSAGVTLVDFTDPQNPYVKDRYEQPMLGPLSEGQGAGTIWDVWYYQGYLFTGDTSNGVDVLTLN